MKQEKNNLCNLLGASNGLGVGLESGVGLEGVQAMKDGCELREWSVKGRGDQLVVS